MVNYSDRALDAVFHALADPTRRRMVVRLRRGEATVSELAKPLTISLPAATKHLRVLEEAGLVATEKQGRTRYCRLTPKRIDKAQRFLEETQAFWRSTLDSLEAHLNEGENDDE